MIRFFGKFIDYPSAIAGAVIMGGIVGFVNSDHGLWPAFTAALKQAGYTFFFGGVLIKLLYLIVMRIKPKVLAILVSTLAISIITIILVYLLHSMKGTPKPLESTLPTVIMAPPGFLALAWRKKYKATGDQTISATTTNDN